MRVGRGWPTEHPQSLSGLRTLGTDALWVSPRGNQEVEPEPRSAASGVHSRRRGTWSEHPRRGTRPGRFLSRRVRRPTVAEVRRRGPRAQRRLLYRGARSVAERRQGLLLTLNQHARLDYRQTWQPEDEIVSCQVGGRRRFGMRTASGSVVERSGPTRQGNESEARRSIDARDALGDPAATRSASAPMRSGFDAAASIRSVGSARGCAAIGCGWRGHTRLQGSPSRSPVHRQGTANESSTRH